MPGSIAGAFLSGSKPKIPQYPTVDIQGEQNAATQGNINALPGLETLASRVDSFNASEFAKHMESIFPGYSQILAKGTDILKSQMRGEIPEDVRRQIGRLSAEKSRGGGYAGSEFADNLEARDLGLTSLDIIDRSLGTAERWMAQAASKVPRFDFTRMFVSPQERINVRLYENQQRFGRDLMAARVAAMPEPWETALKNFFDNVEEMGQAALGAYAGGQMGGGGGASSMAGAGKSGGGGSSGAWAYEGSTNYRPSAAPQLNDFSGTYYEEPVQSYDLGPDYFKPVGQSQWGGT